MTALFDSFQQRGVTFRNRIGVSPMCQYSSQDGLASDWHLVHLVSRAVGGAGVVFTEAASVKPEGRISPGDLGIWADEHIPMLAKIAKLIQEAGAVPGIQLAHAGRKASCALPWAGGNPLTQAEGGWQPVAPSAIAFNDMSPVPTALTPEGIKSIKQSFIQAAQRSINAGFQVIEIHAAHGYLLHEFLSPLSNHRTDRYGDSFAGRVRLLVEIVQAVRAILPDHLPLWVRISATDWAEGGWDLEQSIALSQILKTSGVDLVDCSTGGLIPGVKIPTGPGYQVPFSDRIRQDTGIATAAVGMITAPEQADRIIRTGQADMVLLARELLRDPYWPHRAAKELRVDHHPYPKQYQRAW
ncbi:MAG: NADH:flavin oxidoreductase/NADH oxidase [Microcoleus sp. PH2017_25_DOB_D_A]|uniref:NADH:flavin oxidoreductase/NADH oxidase n=1 Tax=unclassified Microcoleus TaxID=2642155 RepID=UPI001D43A8A7|nr:MULTISPECIES: NADH:flavin oxidoreductase/NADH oxidase [unclassified Microcoleus]MCC3535757.1 NADH:flavin oxidoreductase/NADH oxidase [Microcoleus sp. PH2017_25_DOB_D_A]MCC3547860.1 NADH:flavin oxidoreductase/NADH oxidase [Microcoleus sp. PH2017_24_DOB_U_A]